MYGDITGDPSKTIFDKKSFYTKVALGNTVKYQVVK